MADPERHGEPPPDHPPLHQRARARLRAWIVSFALMNVVWLLLIAAFDFWETMLGLVASAFAATAIEAVREQGFVQFRPKARWIAPIWRLPGRTLVETVLVFRFAWRRVTRDGHAAGRFYTVPLELDEDDPGRAAAKRALFTLGESIAPNTYVVGYDEDARVMLMHELAPRRRSG